MYIHGGSIQYIPIVMLLIRKIPTFTALVRGELIIFNFVDVHHMGEILFG